MIDSEKIKADFVLQAFRVKKVDIKTEDVIEGRTGQVHFSFDYNLSHEEHEDSWYGDVEFMVSSFAEHDNEPMFNINLIVVGKYSSKKESMDEKLFLEFLEHNGITMIIPLTRSFLQTATCQWGIGPPLLFPSINVSKLIESHRKKQK